MMVSSISTTTGSSSSSNAPSPTSPGVAPLSPASSSSSSSYSRSPTKRPALLLSLSPPPLKKRRRVLMNDDSDPTIDALGGVSTLPNFLNFPSFDDESQLQQRQQQQKLSSSTLPTAGGNNTNDIPRTTLNRRTRCVVESTKDDQEGMMHEQPSAAASAALETKDCCNEEPLRDDQGEGQSCEQHDGRHEEEQPQVKSSVSSSSHCLQQLGSSSSFMTMSMSMKELTSPCSLLRRLSLTNIAGTAEASSSAAPAAPLPSSLSSPSYHRATVRPITRSSFDCLKMPELPDFMVDHTDCGANTGSRRSSCVGTEAAAAASGAAAAAAGASPPRNLHAREDRRRKSATTATFDYLATALRLSL
eukprot:CAMPEP_0113460196 /NCGR_PEP_ID=MMETSP0014_2-20120614/10856_1 /TAXON_ID=2857 /ORGANISM="Nitzschia sp." /LENGTH=359 /DNA_ID=CAMNT_0000351829 /DNA_START=200 /DNA_END=1279 /DNA_ORIENTATION=+ /assembly_acc=CAM_ASM_000159